MLEQLAARIHNSKCRKYRTLKHIEQAQKTHWYSNMGLPLLGVIIDLNSSNAHSLKHAVSHEMRSRRTRTLLSSWGEASTYKRKVLKVEILRRHQQRFEGTAHSSTRIAQRCCRRQTQHHPMLPRRHHQEHALKKTRAKASQTQHLHRSKW